MSTSTYAPQKFARQWLPEGTELKTWEQIEPWFQLLLDRPLHSPAELEEWLRDVGELNGAVSQEREKRHVAMTCQTDDPDREAAYLAFVRDIDPKLKPPRNALREKYLDSPFRQALRAERYGVFNRAEENRRALFREANIPRETRQAELEQQYQKIIGAMTVTFRGQEYTPAQMARFLEETDRATREEAWRLVAARRLTDRDALDSLFDELLKLRCEIAREAEFSSYTDFAYRQRERFDYGVKDATQFQNAIEAVVVPLATRIQEERKAALGIESLRPWDLAVDIKSRPPLRPFTDAEQLASGTEAIFQRIDPELGAQFHYLSTHGLLDLANRKGKAPGGYQTTFEDDRLPFIFMNAVGIDSDLRTLLHEGGHAFHALGSRHEALAAYREAPIEFCEVASMSMELLGAADVDTFYGPADANRSHRQLLEGIVLILPWIATVDAFQHWIYANPEHSREERRAAWSGLLRRFGGIVDWSGLEDARESSWHRQLHIFLYPFYYIEYGIAQLGALQIWKHSLENRKNAVAAYRRALALGGAKPLPDLFAAAGIRLEFTEATLKPLMEAIGRELDRIGD
jgi:oligoendopeptidase F